MTAVLLCSLPPPSQLCQEQNPTVDCVQRLPTVVVQDLGLALCCIRSYTSVEDVQ